MENPQPMQPSQDRYAAALPRPVPWNPYRIVGFVFIVSAFVVGIVLGLNWKRLGKPEWQMETILLSILVPGAALVLAMFWVIAFVGNRDLPILVIASVPFLAMGINLGFPWALARLQNGAYKAYQSGGWEALDSYSYDIGGAVLFGVMAAVLVGLAATVFGFLFNR